MAETKKILVVDDEKNVVAYLETLLQDNGYETLSASNGREALEKTISEKPDLVTLDITMPEKSGVRYYRDIKENPDLAGIPVVIVTAVTGFGGDPEEFNKFISTRKQIPPPDGFVSKPIEQEKFLEIIKEVLSK